MVVCKVRVQKTAEIPPKTTSALITLSPRMAFITYKGDVPISPYIIPSVISNPPNDNFECRFLCDVLM
jgi:hypothetical protein